MGHLPGKKVTRCRSTTHMTTAVAEQRWNGDSFDCDFVLISMLGRKRTEEPVALGEKKTKRKIQSCWESRVRTQQPWPVWRPTPRAVFAVDLTIGFLQP